MGLFEEEHLSWVEKIILFYKICYVYNASKHKTHKKAKFSENFKIVCVWQGKMLIVKRLLNQLMNQFEEQHLSWIDKTILLYKMLCV
jgi:hypothetical protein